MRLVTTAIAQGFAREPHHQPRRDDHGDEERKDHRRRGVDRDRGHVRAHQPRDEQHRQQSRHHGQGRHHGRIADLRHSFDRRLLARSIIIHGPVPGDVLDHHNRVVDQDADREDQREQTDPVDRIAHQV